MTGADLAIVLSTGGAVLGGSGTVVGFFYARARNARNDLKAQVKAQQEAKADRDATHVLAQAAYDLADATRVKADGLRSEVTAQESRVAILESKMDVFWRNVAFDVSKILHSPHEGWEELDALLEKFQARDITDLEMADLETQLRDMVEGRWEPAEVTRADQVAASLLLRAIEQTR